jgi:hypothetical protein
MQYRTFGQTGFQISALGFGAMRLPTREINGQTVFDTETSMRMMHRAFELGVNYIDTAPYYCDGESEIIVGQALKGWRQSVCLSTKNPIENSSGADWRRRLERSLTKLSTDTIDYYHLWGISWKSFTDKIDVPDGPLSAALKAREEGLIKHLSFSFHDQPDNLIRLVDTGCFTSVLCQYNLLDRSNESAMAYAHSKGLGVIVMGPVGGGRLGAPSETIEKLLTGKRASSAEIALRFVLANPHVDCALSGMGSLDMVEENAAVASDPSSLRADETERIKTAMEENKKLADLYCTGCNYCMPCPFEVNIPLNFKLMNEHRVYGLTQHAREQYQLIGNNSWMKGKNAAACTECGVCEQKCPQKIEIRKQLKETAAALG